MSLKVSPLEIEKNAFFFDTGAQESFQFKSTSKDGQFGLFEKFEWVKDGSPCTQTTVAQASSGIVASTQSNDKFPVGVASGMTLKLKPGKYVLCWDNGSGSFVANPLVTLQLAGLVPDAEEFYRVAGATTSFLFTHASNGGWGGFETAYWTDNSVCGGAAETDANHILRLTGLNMRRARTNDITLDVVKFLPGIRYNSFISLSYYYCCYVLLLTATTYL